jgi:hypothetical protein
MAGVAGAAWPVPALGEQVEQPLQLGGAGLQVRGELRPGHACRARW